MTHKSILLTSLFVFATGAIGCGDSSSRATTNQSTIAQPSQPLQIDETLQSVAEPIKTEVSKSSLSVDDQKKAWKELQHAIMKVAKLGNTTDQKVVKFLLSQGKWIETGGELKPLPDGKFYVMIINQASDTATDWEKANLAEDIVGEYVDEGAPLLRLGVKSGKSDQTVRALVGFHEALHAYRHIVLKVPPMKTWEDLGREEVAVWTEHARLFRKHYGAKYEVFREQLLKLIIDEIAVRNAAYSGPPEYKFRSQLPHLRVVGDIWADPAKACAAFGVNPKSPTYKLELADYVQVAFMDCAFEHIQKSSRNPKEAETWKGAFYVYMKTLQVEETMNP